MTKVPDRVLWSNPSDARDEHVGQGKFTGHSTGHIPGGVPRSSLSSPLPRALCPLKVEIAGSTFVSSSVLVPAGFRAPVV